MGQLVRFLIIAFVVWLAIRLLRRFLRSLGDHDKSPATAPRMLPCARCGVHVPETAAFMYADRAYCSEEHRQIGPP